MVTASSEQPNLSVKRQRYPSHKNSECTTEWQSVVRECSPDSSNIFANIGFSGNSAICKPRGSVNLHSLSIAEGDETIPQHWRLFLVLCIQTQMIV